MTSQHKVAYSTEVFSFQVLQIDWELGRRMGIKMSNSLGLCVVFCFAIFSLGSALSCYKCQDYSGRCSHVQQCSYEDACLRLIERGGKTIRQCIRYTDCDRTRLSQMFPAISSFTHMCCSSNLCNSGTAAAISKPLLGSLGSLVVLWWCLL